MKIILTSKPTYQGYSIEAGKADNQKHFDHHGEFEKYPSPCNNKDIQPIEDLEIENVIIEITHIDADTYCGILRLLGKELPNIDLKLLEKIDNNGSSVCQDKFDKTLLYMIGIGKLQRDLKFPRVSAEPQDVTSIVQSMFNYSIEDIIKIGKEAQVKAEDSYFNCELEHLLFSKILFSINEDDNLDPSRAYEDNYKVVVVYRQHYKTISIYCNPKSDYTFEGKIIAGIEFNGHPKACGSPRGVEYTEEQAKQVYNAIRV